MNLSHAQTRNRTKALTSRKSDSLFTNNSQNVVKNNTENNNESNIVSKTPMKRYYRYRPNRLKIKKKAETESSVKSSITRSIADIQKYPPTDYLRDMRIQRESDSRNKVRKQNVSEWRSIKMSNRYDNRTKLAMIKETSQMIDQKVRLKEKILKSNGQPLDETNEVNKMIVDSIEAKLSILNDLNST